MKSHVKLALKARGITADIPWCCEVCAKPYMVSSLDCHHIVFRSDGGSDWPDNTILICRDCHGMAHQSKISADELHERTMDVQNAIQDMKHG